MVPAAKDGLSSSSIKSALFQLLADKSPFGIIIFRGEKVFYVNKRLSKLSGYPLKQLRAWKIEDFISMIPKEDRGNAVQFYGEMFSGKASSYHYQFRFPHKKRGMRWVDAIGTVVKVGEEPYLQVKLIDITAHRQLEMAVEESEAKYRSFVQNFHGIAYRAIIDSVVEFFHGAVEEITGYAEEDFVSGRVLWDKLVHPEDWGRLEKDWKRIGTEPGATSDREYRIIRMDGTIRWMRDIIRNICDEGGVPVSVEGVLYDITERKRAEEAFHSLVEYSLQGLVIVQEGRIAFANTAFAEILGYTVEEILSWSPKQVRAYVHPEDQSLVWGRHEARLKGEQVPSNYEFRVNCKDRSFRWLEVFAQRIEYREKPAVQASYVDVTERKHAEAAHREAEVKYRSLMEQTQEGIVIGQGPPPRLVFANPAMEKILGYTPEELTSMTPEELLTLIHSDDREMFFGRWADRLAGRPAPSRYEVRGIRKDGTVRWVEVFSIRIEYDGQPAAQATFIDITEVKEAELALRRSEERYRELITKLPEGVEIVDLDENIIFANRAYAAMLGYDREELIGMSVLDTIDEGEIEKVRAETEKRKRGESSTYELAVIAKDGSRRIVRVHAVPERAEDGTIKGTISVVTDITERKQAEAALQESEAKYRVLVEYLPQGLLIFQGGQLAFLNPAAAKIVGSSMEELQTKSLEYILAKFHPDDRAEFIKRQQDRQKGKPLEHHWEFRFRKNSSVLIWCEAFVTEIEYKGKPALQVVLVDITERKQAEQALQTSEEKYRSVIDQMQEGLVIIQGERVVFANSALCRITGYSLEEVLSLTPAEVWGGVYAEDRERVMTDIRDRLAGKDVPSHSTVRAFRKDGTMYWVQASAQLIEYLGKPAIQASFLDVSSRREAELAAKESEARYRSLFDHVPIGLYISSPGGQIIDANPALVQLLGHADRESLIARKATEFYVNPEVRQQWLDLIAREGVVRDFEAQFRLPDGRLIWIVNNARAIQDSSGKALYYEGSMEDITERKRAQEGLAGSEAKFRALVEGTSDWVVELDSEGNVTYSNNAIEGVLGITAGQMIGRSLFDFMIEEDGPPARAAYGQYVLKGKPFENLVYRFTHRTGERVILEGGGRPIFDEQHSVIGFRGIFRNITERVEAAGAVRESEEKYRYLVEQSLQGLAIFQGIPPRIVFVNPAFAEMLGYAPDQLVALSADSVSALVPPEDFPKLMERFSELVAGAPSFPRSIRMVRKDKDIRWVLLFGHRIDYQGQPALQAYAIDVTEHKETETEYRTLVEASPDPIVLTDLQGRILMVNEQTVKLYGYTREELIGMNSFELVIPEDQQRAMREMQMLLQQRTSRAVEYSFLRKDGTTIPMEQSAAPILDPDGKPRALLMISRDITERKETLAILQERQEQYRLLYENIVAGIFLTDSQGVITMCNAHGAKLFGYTPTELTGTPVASLVHSDDRDRILHQFREGIRLGKTLEGGMEARGLRKDGSTFYFHETSTILLKDGKPDGFQSVMLDVTAIKEAQAELQAEQDRIEFLNDLMVHDLINVNQGILSVLELQLRDPTLPEGLGELVELALTQVTRSTALIARMRRLSRIKTEIPQFEAIDIAVALQSAVESLEEALPEKTLHLETNIEAGKYMVQADSLLFDLFYNLLSRALKSDRRKQVSVDLKVGPAQSKGFLQILYKDRVPPSSPEEERAQRLGKVTGDRVALDLGISLTLVERIVTRYGGKVWTQDPTPDSPAEGTILIILLPKPN